MSRPAVELLHDYRPRRAHLLPAALFWLAWALLRWQLPAGPPQRAMGLAAQFWIAYALVWWALSGLAVSRRVWPGGWVPAGLLLAATLGALLGLPLTADFSWHRLVAGPALAMQLLPAISLALALHLLPLAARWRERRKHAAEASRLRQAAAVADLSRQVTLAELKTLQAQVEPHFLYNTLAGIQYLVRHNAVLADRMLGRLHDYLRLALPAMRQPMSTLGSEFALADAYLALMQMRLGERLRVTIDLPQALAGRPFPPLMLGNLIENAVQHGIEPKPGGGALHVQARAREGGLELEVSDSGVGLQAAALGQSAGSGLGLSSLRERLLLLYGQAARLDVGANAQGGVSAVIWVPHQDS
ncbi:sensor histidine kinase [Roseateles sp.]|uniref:sensor histidine kinase n=1 Tax=Roseateles sp. TaxID=1971397 RepID=UPI0025CE95E4|nr:histidine kinase [Roseateles sp.]MBV8034435.1 histidine kinase [Roseateles sp.]